MSQSTVELRVWGDFACFTRPEFNVERVSYPIITPSAARGVLEAIFWRPEIRYEIRRIGVLSFGQPFVMVRNEISSYQGKQPLVADLETERQQRSSLILREVDYIIHADVRLQPHAREPLPKYLDQVRRRIERGQCFHTPYLGCREFTANFGSAHGLQPLDIDQRLGTVLFDVAFVPDSERKEMTFRIPGTREIAWGYHHALFAPNSRLGNGWWDVPVDLYQQLYRLGKGDV